MVNRLIIFIYCEDSINLQLLPSFYYLRVVRQITMDRNLRVLLYFLLWVILALISVLLNILNIDWKRTNIAQGIITVLVLGILQGSVLEFPVQTIATLFVGGKREKDKKKPIGDLTLIMNYNLLALGRDDVDECFRTMYDAYMSNIGRNISAVLVSATNEKAVKEYEIQCRDHFRAIIYDELFREGVAFANNQHDDVMPWRLEHLWQHYADVDRIDFLRDHLDDICDKFAKEFMLVHRTHRVVRKCGQYQDLMLLSEGDDEAFSYTDPEYYGKQARTFGEPLFVDSEDVENIFGRRFAYTLVLDGDTGVPEGTVFELLQIASANSDKGIIQPAIKLHCTDDDTMYMHLEAMRQTIYEPMTNAMTSILGQSGYFGKALINNRLYIDSVIGTRDNLIERVPIDVLSHDTFEAALLKPYYAGSVFLLEAPSYNYVTWNIRERRWNRGEVLLAMYFWKNAFGVPMRWLQEKLQGEKFNRTKLRTESKLDFVSSYIAHSALRQMFMKPLLLVFILLHINITLRHTYAPIVLVLFLVLIFPKFATCNRNNYKYVLIETLASIVQFTPEAMVGCVRIVRAVQANVSASCKWVPQRAVEEDFRNSNPFVSSLKHLWGYSLTGIILSVLVIVFLPSSMLVLIILMTLVLLPLYTGLTSLSMSFKSSKAINFTRYGDSSSMGSIPSLDSIATVAEFSYKYDPFRLRVGDSVI